MEIKCNPWDFSYNPGGARNLTDCFHFWDLGALKMFIKMKIEIDPKLGASDLVLNVSKIVKLKLQIKSFYLTLLL